MAYTTKPIVKFNKGFTLIEVLLVVIMLSVLITILFGALNPFTQFNKANDAKREQDLTQIKNALDTYYNDTGCYPTGVPFDFSWTVGKTLLMSQVPDDPECTTSGKCYLYQTDSSTCPQWNILYAALKVPNTSSNKVLCPLFAMGNCAPAGIASSSYNYCIVSGNPNCSYVSQNSLPSANSSGNGRGTPGWIPSTPTVTPTPTIPCSVKIYSCTAYSSQDPNGVCQNVGSGGDYCGTPCQLNQIPPGNICCDNQCSR